MKHIEKFVDLLGEAYNGMTIQPELGANHVDTENFRFRTGGGCRIELGCLFCRSGGQTAWPSCEQTPAGEEKTNCILLVRDTLSAVLLGIVIKATRLS